MKRGARTIPRGFWWRRGALAFLLACVTTLALAWGPFFAPWDHGTMHHRLFKDVSGAVRVYVDRYDLRSRWTTIEQYLVHTHSLRALSEPELASRLRRILPWSSVRAWRVERILTPRSMESTPDGPVYVEPIVLVSSGWPRRCLIMARTFPASWPWQNVETDSSLVVPAPWGLPSGATQTISLPIRPLWFGLAIDVALFGGVWFGVVAGPRAMRVHWRLRRGRCPECGYDLAAEFVAGCSECGWGRGEKREAQSVEAQMKSRE